MTIISRMEKDEGQGSCTLDNEAPREMYEEIRDFMFDAPSLTNVEIISFDELRNFIESDAATVELGYTDQEHFGRCTFELTREC